VLVDDGREALHIVPPKAVDQRSQQVFGRDLGVA